MTSENLDLVRSIYAAWERGDFSQAEWADPDIEYVIADGPMPGTWRGVAGMARGMREFLRGFEGYRVEADAYREVDDERVLVLAHSAGRGKSSGIKLEELRVRGANLFFVRTGRVTKLVTYWDRDRAHADLGLTPEGDSQR